MKKRVLIITSYYHPSVKGGGPIRSLKNLVDNLSDKIDFYIITGDRDLGDSKPFDSVETESWAQVESAKVYYTDKIRLNWKKYIQLIDSVNCDVIYINSFFSYRCSIILILLNKIGKLSGKKMILAPRGELSEGALGLKNFKKKLYIQMAKRLKLYDDVKWHSTTEYEMKDIKNVFGERIVVDVASNLTADYQHIEYSKLITKYPGELILVYVSRIHPMKNLLQVLEIIKKLDGQVVFNIFGPIEDKQYWEKCNQIILNMPRNIKVHYNGLIQNDKLQELYKKQHYFILLTLGENFGHAIAEALIGGCPVVISDRTPWRNLENYLVGWDIPLEKKDEILEVLKTL
ncbi:MAG: glycosyltransferase, partial [Clostridiaceae bacterium]